MRPHHMEPRVTSALVQSNIASRKSVSAFGNEESSALLARAAELIEEHGWTSTRQRLSQTDSELLDIVSAILLASGWESGWRGERTWRQNARVWGTREVDQYLEVINLSRKARNGFARTMSYVIAIVKLEDLAMWNDEYCLNQEEAIDVLRQAAHAAREEGD